MATESSDPAFPISRRGRANMNITESDLSHGAGDRGYMPNVEGTAIEVIRPIQLEEPPEHVLFDFDGTLSLIREGWMDVMLPMMVEILRDTPTQESSDKLKTMAYCFVTELTGKQTIYQMIRLAEEVTLRGGTPADPLDYKHQYHDRLMERIGSRREGLRSGQLAPVDAVVPGSFELLETLRAMDVHLYLASGTDEVYVREEAELLGLDAYFGPRIYGAVDDFRTFSKAQVIERILGNGSIVAEKLVGFGDGYVEIQNVKQAGGTAVGVASDESGRGRVPDAWKRQRLIDVGADLIVPDFRDHQKLVECLWKA